MEIHEAMFQLDAIAALGVQEVQVPDGPLADVIAVAPPGFGRRVLSLALLIFIPGRLELPETVVRTEHHAGDFGVFQVARLRHHHEVASFGDHVLAERYILGNRADKRLQSRQSPGGAGQSKMRSP